MSSGGDRARAIAGAALRQAGHVHKPEAVTYAAESLNEKHSRRHQTMQLSGSSGHRSALRRGAGARLRVAVRLCAVALLAVLLSACSWALLDPRGPVAHAERTILIDSLAIMLAIGVPTILATFAFAWWFRASNTRARYRPDWEFSGAIELVVWSIPAMVIILLGGVAWIGSHDLDPAKPLSSREAPLEIQVVSLDWKWLFIYPNEGVASVNELVVPAGVPLRFSLTSASVWNAFFVPQLGSMIYTMNGMRTQLYLRADEPGTFRGMSAHFSGDGFSDMHFPVRSVSLEEFTAWSKSTRGVGPTLDAAGYAALARQGTVPPSTYGAVAPDLFNHVVSQHIPPGPGPATERGGAAEKSPK
jgi:cytochrome o ubiquinol oxidase subunit 2